MYTQFLNPFIVQGTCFIMINLLLYNLEFFFSYETWNLGDNSIIE